MNFPDDLTELFARHMDAMKRGDVDAFIWSCEELAAALRRRIADTAEKKA